MLVGGVAAAADYYARINVPLPAACMPRYSAAATTNLKSPLSRFSAKLCNFLAATHAAFRHRLKGDKCVCHDTYVYYCKFCKCCP
jgi:hypothetical protein